MSFQKSIDSILDTPKVEALMVFDLDGEVCFEQMPEYTNSAMLEKLPQRILTLYDIIADNFQKCSDFILKFEEKNLYFRKSSDKKGKDFVLVIVGAAGINFVSLKLVTNLAMKMIELEDRVPDASLTSESKTTRSKMTYRGQRIDTEKSEQKKPKKNLLGMTYRGQKLE